MFGRLFVMDAKKVCAIIYPVTFILFLMVCFSPIGKLIFVKPIESLLLRTEMTVSQNRDYEKAIELVENGDFAKGTEKIKRANRAYYYKKYDQKDAYTYFFDYKDGDELYKDSAVIYCYAKAALERDSSTIYAKELLDTVPNSYYGVFADQIRQLKSDILPLYKIKVAEREAAEKAEIQKYASQIPYVGMNADRIRKTLAGEPDDVDKWRHRGKTTYTYTWKAADGCTVLEVETKEGKVTEVVKYSEDYHWTTDGKPNFSAEHPKRRVRYIITDTPDDNDPYNAKDYSDSEDFYEDNMDEFDSLDDAEDYFDEYGD